METNRNKLREAMTKLGAVLADRGLSFELVLVGGGALNLCGLIARPTKDIDVVARVEGGAYITAVPLPSPLLASAKDVAAALDLAPDWLNAGPADLFHLGLPPGFAERTVRETFGGLTVLYAARQDQIAFKLYAAADHWPARSKHLQDLRELAPARDELRSAADWCITHDASVGFHERQLTPLLRALGVAERADG